MSDAPQQRPPGTLTRLEVYEVLEHVLTQPQRLVAAIADAASGEQVLRRLHEEFGLTDEQAWLVLDQQIIHLTAHMSNTRRRFVSEVETIEVRSPSAEGEL